MSPVLRTRVTWITMVLIWAVIAADLGHASPAILDVLIALAAVLLLLTAIDAIARWSSRTPDDRR
jgi:hypothetical protein